MRFSSFAKKVLFVIILLPGSLLAQSEFEIKGVFRPRLEFRDGYKTLKKPEADPAAFVSQRARLRFNYKNDKLETRFTVFDYRVWGDQLWKKDLATVGVHEIWAALKLTDHSKLILGRQQLSYDNDRFISGVNWNQVGAAHDAARFVYKKNSFELEILTAWNQNSENLSGTDYHYDGELNALFYKNLNVLWLSKKFNKAQLTSFTIVDGFEEVDITDTISPNNPNRLNYRYTTGLVFKQKTGSFDIAARAFYQGGKLYTGTEVSAWYLNFDAFYTLNQQSKVLVGTEIMSGNDYSDTSNTKSNAFDILYGARHKFNGRIDYFSVPSTTKYAGLVNPYAKYYYNFNKTTKAFAELHFFFLQNNYIPENSTQAINKYLGYEIDLTFVKQFTEYINVTGGYSVMFGNEAMEIIKGGESSKLNHWAFVMLTVDPIFFASKRD